MKRAYHTGITNKLRALKIGKSIIVSSNETGRKVLYVYANRLSIKIAVRMTGKRLEVWRLR